MKSNTGYFQWIKEGNSIRKSYEICPQIDTNKYNWVVHQRGYLGYSFSFAFCSGIKTSGEEPLVCYFSHYTVPVFNEELI